MWNYARSRTQINTTINSELTSSTGLVARWGMNEGSGTAVGDSMATPANGTITGTGTSWVTPGAPFDIVVDLTAPAAPTGLDATGGVGRCTLDWSNNGEPDLAGYNVYRSLSSPVVDWAPR